MKSKYTVLGALREDTDFLECFARDVRAGLKQESCKQLPCKYIYDHAGSELFKEIMDLPEYYLTRCETEILHAHAGSIAERVGGRELNLVELGAGDGSKTKLLLNHLLCARKKFTYIPIDISESAIRQLAMELSRDLPELNTHGLVAEYSSGISWLSQEESRRNLVLFLGSSIGNFSPPEAAGFLASLREAMRPGDFLLIGFDLVKDAGLLNLAYDDSGGVTARFNFNLLARINRELGGEFNLDSFSFRSGWDPAAGAVQSYLVSTASQEVFVRDAGMGFSLERDEPIHTESSHKFQPEEVAALAGAAGFEVCQDYSDSRGWFLDSLWRAI